MPDGVTASSAPAVPPTRKAETVDILHGRLIKDPYRWLEDTDAPETRDWIDAQNAASTAYLESLPNREVIRERLTELFRVTIWGVPREHAGRWFFTRRDAGADQPCLRVAASVDADGQVLIDPAELSSDGTVALVAWDPSPDGSLVAYATSSAGSDWMTWRVREVATGEDLPDLVEWSKWSSAAWLPDGSGFFYGCYEPPDLDSAYRETNEDMRLSLHRLGTHQAADKVIWTGSDAYWDVTATSIDHHRWLVMEIRVGTNIETVVTVIDLIDPALTLRPLLPTPDASATVVGNDGSTFYLLTNAGAPNRRIVAIDLDEPDAGRWREVVPEGDDSIDGATVAGDRLVVHVLRDASSQLEIWSAAGEQLGRVDLPAFVSITDISASRDSEQFQVGTTSFTDPGSVLLCDAITGTATPLRPSESPVDVESVVISRELAPSADGTAVPMFLVRRAGVEPTGDVRTLLSGYGGFEIPIVPFFRAADALWVERGGLLVVANLRGGGEYGKAWYDAGRLQHKQNVFDDFAGCARWLVSSGWTRARRIVVNGGSNGGLLVGAMLTQHPELVGAAVPEVGVLDLLRYHLFTIGWGWKSDYPDPDDPEQFPWGLAISPLHNVVEGTRYPPTLVLTGDHDDRVVPGHSFKFAAAMQAAQGGDAPVLIRIETSAGHGAGTPVSKLVAARTDFLAFAEHALAAES